MKEKLKMAACGLDCNACDLYNAAFDEKAAGNLVGWFKSEGWIEKETAAEVMTKAPFCEGGCWSTEGEHWFRDCKVLNCCKEKNIEHCAECDTFPCSDIASFCEGEEPTHHKAAYEKLTCLHKQNK